MRKVCPDSLAGRGMLVCTHVRGATSVFLKTLIESGAGNVYHGLDHTVKAVRFI